MLGYSVIHNRGTSVQRDQSWNGACAEACHSPEDTPDPSGGIGGLGGGFLVEEVTIHLRRWEVRVLQAERAPV